MAQLEYCAHVTLDDVIQLVAHHLGVSRHDVYFYHTRDNGENYLVLNRGKREESMNTNNYAFTVRTGGSYEHKPMPIKGNEIVVKPEPKKSPAKKKKVA